jgi:hypothetical protein
VLGRSYLDKSTGPNLFNAKATEEIGATIAAGWGAAWAEPAEAPRPLRVGRMSPAHSGIAPANRGDRWARKWPSPLDVLEYRNGAQVIERSGDLIGKRS